MRIAFIYSGHILASRAGGVVTQRETERGWLNQFWMLDGECLKLN